MVLLHRIARGKTSGAEIGQMRASGANLFHIRDGKVTKIVLSWDSEHLFADLGLASEGDSP
jgi:hypothetical protein